jgi:SAM-dependent methyltransferase
MAATDFPNDNRTSYQIIAPYYDWIMSHVDYTQWAEYILSLLKKYRCIPKAILELGAGTCSFLKTNRFPAQAMAVVNALAIPFKSRFDLCIMIYDSINYLLNEKEMEKCLREVHGALKHKGLFIFDITTEFNSKVFFQDDLEYEEKDDCAVIRQSWYDKKHKLQHNDFIYFINTENETYKREQESHVQRIYTLSEMQKIIDRAPFVLKGLFDNFSLKTAGPQSERVHYVLQKI